MIIMVLNISEMRVQHTVFKIDPADKSRSIFDPVILSSDMCSLYKSRSTSVVLVW